MRIRDPENSSVNKCNTIYFSEPHIVSFKSSHSLLMNVHLNEATVGSKQYRLKCCIKTNFVT